MKEVGKDFVFFVVGPSCWGKGETEAKAKSKARRAGQRRLLNTYLLYLTPPDATLDAAGNFHWKDDTAEAILLKTVVKGKEVTWS